MAEEIAVLAKAEARYLRVSAQKARLVVFPECELSGYMLDDLDELEHLAEPVPGPAFAGAWA